MMSKRASNWYESMLRKAAHLGQLSDIPNYKIGAILVRGKGIISTGYNKQKTHPMQRRLNVLRGEGKRERTYVHAEIDCISCMRSAPKGSVLFIGRFDAKGNPAICRPCEACMEGIRLHGIRELVYNTPNGFAVEKLTKD